MAHDGPASRSCLLFNDPGPEMEHLMGEIIDLLCEKLDKRFVETGAKCDITDYVPYGESNRTWQVISTKC